MSSEGIIFLLISAGFVGFLCCVVAYSVREDERKRRKDREALEEKANAGDMESMLALANTIEAEEGYEWMEKAASNGSQLAQFKCAQEYEWRGDHPKAFEFMLESAQGGYEPAMEALARIYLNGKGVLKNIGQSTDWFIKSAEKGNKASQLTVATAYLEGFGVDENPMEGLAWLYYAEFVGSEEAKTKITALEKSLKNQTILGAQNRAKELMELCKQGKPTRESASFSPIIGGPEAWRQAIKPHSAPKGSGSGAVVSPAGHIVTAAHVLTGARYIEVVTASATLPASVAGLDVANDLALLKIEKAQDNFLHIAHSKNVRLGQTVATIGFPNIGIQGHSPKVTQGVISAECGIQNDIRMWQISVPVQPGNSGGPLLDESGGLVGVVAASLSLRAIQVTGAVPQNVNYAVKSAYLEPILNQHGLSVGRGTSPAPAKFEDMVESAKKCSVLVLVY